MNLHALRGFFTGVIGWPPRAMRHDATLQDLAEAYAAWQAQHRMPASGTGGLPGAVFLREMTARYPDGPAPKNPPA